MRPEIVWLLIFFEISENRLNGFENSKTVITPIIKGYYTVKCFNNSVIDISPYLK